MTDGIETDTISNIEFFKFLDGKIGLDDLTFDGGDDPGTIVGTGGADTLVGTAGNDIFRGAQGDDTLLGGEGSDTYLYASGDSSDYIDDESGSTTDIDVLRFTDLNVTEVTCTVDCH